MSVLRAMVLEATRATILALRLQEAASDVVQYRTPRGVVLSDRAVSTFWKPPSKNPC